MHTWLRARVNLAICLSLLLCVAAQAQTGTAIIVGTVTDATGASLQEVKVVATNLDTGFTVTATTSASGDYRIPGLSPGNYQVRADKDNFSSELRKGITLTVAQQLEVNFALKVGSVKQEVAVTDLPPLVDSVTSSLSGVIDQKQMEELPLNGRDLWQLVLLQPGVNPNPNAGPSPWQKGGFGKAAVNGQRPTNNNLTVDGMDANDPNFNITPGGAAGVLLGVDAIREFRVFTDTYNAEYGRNSGSVIEMITKSGTNGFHGSAFEFIRNARLDAKNYFDLPNISIPPFIRNQFGGSFGGPIKKDKAFFFANYEGFREGQGTTAVSTVPNTLAHQGLLPDPANPTACTQSNPGACINVGVNPLTAPYLAIVALPNGPDFGNGTAQITSTERRITNEDYLMGRFDYNFSSTHSGLARYIYDGSSSDVPYLSTLVPGFPGKNNVRAQYLTLQDQKFLTPNVLNLAAFGFNRLGLLAEPIDTHPGLSISLLPNRPLGVFSISGLGNIGNNLIYPLGSYSNTYQFQDNISWTKGKHAIKFGGEFRRMQINGPFDLFVNGEYVYQDLSAFGVPSVSNNPGLENFLKGIPFVYVGINPSASNSVRGFRQSGISGYLQDDWRVNRKLTLNLGLRYEFYTNPTEAEGKAVNIRNLATDTSTTVGKFMNSTPKDLLTPRFGFAWNIGSDGKTVLRGGVGEFNDQIWANIYGNARSLPPFYQAVESIFPQFLSPLNSPLPIGTTANATVTYYPKWPMVFQYNLNLQHELTSSSVVTLAYVGSRGNHLGRLAEANPLQPSGTRPNPNFGSIVRYLTDAQSFYNGMLATWEQRTKKGLTFQANYDYSHSIDDSSGYNPSDAVNDSGKSQDINNRKGSRGRSGFDIRQNLVINAVYELPFGPGKTFASNTSGASAKLVSGWQLTPIISIHSNVPFTPVLGFDNAGTASIVLSDRPNLVGNPFSGTCPNGASVRTPTCWFNPQAYGLPPSGQFGNASRNSIPGPPYKEVDLSLAKITPIGEGKSLEFRAEFFNLANHPNFAVPTNTTGPNGNGGNGDAVILARENTGAPIYASNGGQIFSTVGSSRQIQFGLKFQF
jgi:Carboxypeptidase regulatory-like domain/TonB-dependent Receptor Plug Domain/TonB dependent receptor